MKKLNKENIEDIFALTPMQEGLLFHYLKDPESGYYFAQLSLEISGNIDEEIFEKAWNFVIETNEMLRAVFRWVKVENPVQIILREHSLQHRYYDFSDSVSHEIKKRLEQVKLKDREEKFDLREVPFRVILCKVGKDKYEMIISKHQILYDGWSNGIILKEFFQAYDDLANGKDLVKRHKTRFKKFIQWVRNQDIEKQENYWRSYLEGFDARTKLPVKRKKAAQVNNNKTYRWQWGRGKTNEFTVFLKKHKLTLASLLYCAWGILLQKYNNTDEMVFGTRAAGRDTKWAGIEDIVGLFINTLPLRTRIRPHEKAGDLLNRMETELQLRQNYEHSSPVNIRKWSEISKGQELFDSLVILENYPLENRLINKDCGLSIDTFRLFEITHYDLTVIVTTFDKIEVKLICHRDLFDDETIERLIDRFARIVETLMENPGGLAAEIEIVSEEEKNKILYDFNDTGAEYPCDKTIHQLFAEQVERTPARISLIDDSIFITYEELNRKSNPMAYSLIEKGIKPGTIVGIMMERSLEMIIGTLGILKAGGAYLPIDPQNPDDRIDYILADSNARVFLKSNAIKQKKFENHNSNYQKKQDPCTVLDFDHLSFEFVSNFDIRASNFRPSGPAYIIYTSGTTGKPKGVIVEHSAVMNRLFWVRDKYRLNERDVILQATSFVFDVSVCEMFRWIPAGGKLCLLPAGGEKDPGQIVRTIARNGVTTADFIPAMLTLLLDHAKRQNLLKELASLRWVWTGVEVVNVDLVKEFNESLHRLNRTRLINAYGPTESTVDVTYFDCSTVENHDVVPIGRPMANVRLYILTRYGAVQPVGVYGHLCIAGKALARGYLNNPELTAEKFDQDLWDYQDYHDLKKNEKKKINKKLLRGVLNQWISGSVGQLDDSQMQIGNLLTMMPRPHPEMNEIQHKRFAQHIGSPRRGAPGRRRQKIYRTGDLARWLADGNIEFLGRVDHQVKIRGFRIELGEIENQLLTHRKVKEAIVLAREDNNDKYLCAYIAAKPGETNPIDQSGLREYLSNRLPGYMVPSYFVQLDNIPLTPNGKVDRKALPEPGMKTDKNYIPPGNEIEKKLVDIWYEVLDVKKEKIGINDNFFQLGGHSLRGTLLTSMIHKGFDVLLPLAEVFMKPTILELAEVINGMAKDKYTPIEPAEKKEYYVLSSAQKRLYFLQQMTPEGTVYNMPQVTPLDEITDTLKLASAFKQLINRHESLRTSFLLIDGEPVQRVHQRVTFPLDYLEIKDVNGLQAVINRFVNSFDLSRAPLLRAAVVEVEQGQHLLLTDMHHIIGDGVSNSIQVKDFTALYQGEELPPPRLQYKDFSQWQNSRQVIQKLTSQKDYWLREFPRDIPRLNLPGDYPNPGLNCFEGDTYAFEINMNQTMLLKQMALEQGTTIFMVMLAIFYVLLAKVSQQEDIIIGTAVAGRGHADLQQIIGMFVNMLALRNYPRANLSFLEFLGEVKQRSIKAFENQEFQFEQLLMELDINRTHSFNPLFDVVFSMDTLPAAANPFAGGRGSRESRLDLKTSKFALSLDGTEIEGQLHMIFEYSSLIFKKKRIQRFSRYFKEIVSTILTHKDIQLKEIILTTNLFDQKINNPMVALEL